MLRTLEENHSVSDHRADRLFGNAFSGVYLFGDKPIFLNDILILAAGVLLIFTGVGFLIGLYFSLFRFSSRGFALPVLFMNAGNMGIPLALFAFGEPGLQRATLMFVIITFLQYSLGIYLLSGRGNWTEIFRLPLIYATIAGLILNLSRMTIPELLFQPISMLGQATIPIMLVSLGYRLHEFQSFKWRQPLAALSFESSADF